MRKRFDTDQQVTFTRELLIGLGESSARKSHYPELQRRISELERFQLLLDQALDAIFLLDSETGLIMYVNSTAISYCGGCASELIGATLDRWLAIPGHPSISDAESVFLTPFRSEECCLTNRDGIILPVEVSIKRVELQEGAFLVIVARDITERKRLQEYQCQVHEELHANYEELEALYGQLSTAEDAMRQKVQELEISQASLAESETRYRLALEGANDAIWDWDLRRRKLSVSHNWHEKIGFTSDDSDEYITLFASRVHPEDASARATALASHFAGETDHYRAEYRIQLTSGEWVWILSRGKALFDEKGNPVRMCGSYTDITERRQQQERMVHIAFHDALTGLPNRYSLNQVLAGISGKYEETVTGVFLLDLDNFKLVNDSWGHSVGDKLLNEIAGRLRTVEMKGITVFRLGGDEFVIVMDKLTRGLVSYWAERILGLFDPPAMIQETQLPLSTSVGVALFQHGMNPEDVLRHADIALHQAKNAGKQTWRLYQPEMQQPILERIRLERELRIALKEEQFLLYFQPQYSLHGFPVAMEALLRWDHSEKGLVPPLSFIPVAEETGMIIPIGDWVLRSACQFGRLYTERYGGLRVAVNVSARQLMQDDFTQRVLAIIEQENFPPELLELELTESVLMESFDANVSKLKKLRNRGIRIALDDFGTGYSSLTYLSKLPIDTLKIDKSFIHEASKQKDSSIVGIIIKLAHELKLSVVAEGVETIEQLNTLQKLGCDYLQGYLTNPPLPLEQAQQVRRTIHPMFSDKD